MLIVDTDSISGGSWKCRDIAQDLKTPIGGELKAHTDMRNDARALAAERMTDAVASLGADAVVNVGCTASPVMQGAAEVAAHGTAVRFK